MDRHERGRPEARPAVRMWQASTVSAVGLAALLLAVAPGSRLCAQEAFTPAEQAMIARNASLRAMAARDPALARRALAALSAPTEPRLQTETQPAPELGTRDIPLGPETPLQPGRGAPSAGSGAGTGGDFDAAQDPDLGALQRASPEAAHELFLLLKRASASPTRKPME